jgi:hypothetical protein
VKVGSEGEEVEYNIAPPGSVVVGHLSDDALALVKAAQELIERPRGFEKRRFVGDLLVRGYSPKAIEAKYYDAYERKLDRPWLVKLHRRVHYSGKLRKISERQEERILSAGLALKAERVQRLQEYVETIEPAALASPGKAGVEYRRGIQQIKEEVEGLGLDITIHPADAWGQLLQDIRKHAEATTLDRIGSSSGVSSSEPPGDST